jgi:hypothetical protein
LYALGEHVEHDEPAEEIEDEVSARALVATPAVLEDHAEDQRVDGQHHQRHDERPDDAEV